MASRRGRTARRTPSRHRSHGRSGSNRNSNKRIALISGGIIALGLLVWLILSIVGSRPQHFDRDMLDLYVQADVSEITLEPGVDVYFDMSDGMNCAYETAVNKQALKSVIDALAGNKGMSFFGLADLQITPLELSHTELYNYMLNPKNYEKQKAPIGKTLARIVENKKGAVLLTDFEEYKGTVIEQAAYAKEYFIDWLSMGYKITFYKWEFNERGKQKYMFVAVFDDNTSALTDRVATAIEDYGTVDCFVLAGRNFNYPTKLGYETKAHGGNYIARDGSDKDLVSNIATGGGKEAYHCYAVPQATASGSADRYMSLGNLAGQYAEYYPVGLTWQGVLEQVKTYSDAQAVPDSLLYTHFLSQLYVDFAAQSGYTVNGIEVRVFDMDGVVNTITETMAENPETTADQLLNSIRDIQTPEINLVFTAGMEQIEPGLAEIFVDFDPRFNGTFESGINPSVLMRANIVIASATPNVDDAMNFFAWQGNESLAKSVVTTIQDGKCSPVSRVLFSYYIKSIAEK